MRTTPPTPLPPAPHGGQLRLLGEEFALDPRDIVDFSANINPDGPPQGVLAALRAALTDGTLLSCYPDLAYDGLRRAFAHTHGLSHSCIAVANGFVPLLEGFVRTSACERFLLPVPAFSEYRRTLERCGREVISSPLQPPQFSYDLPALANALERSASQAVLLANPQNPTGAIASRASLLPWIAARPDVTFLLDEAFIDYAPEESLGRDAAALGNLIVFRSVTKFFAMPALRVAFAITTPGRTQACADSLAPWAVSALAEIAVRAALKDSAFSERARAINRGRRGSLAESLQRLGLEVSPAAANFLLLRLPKDAEMVRERLLRDHRLALRTCANFEALRGDYLRCAVRTEHENERLIDAFAAVLGRRP